LIDILVSYTLHHNILIHYCNLHGAPKLGLIIQMQIRK